LYFFGCSEATGIAIKACLEAALVTTTEQNGDFNYQLSFKPKGNK
jgi:hypothetical protein